MWRQGQVKNEALKGASSILLNVIGASSILLNVINMERGLNSARLKVVAISPIN